MTKTDVINQIAFELFYMEKQKKAVGKFVDQYPELDEALAYEVQTSPWSNCTTHYSSIL